MEIGWACNFNIKMYIYKYLHSLLESRYDNISILSTKHAEDGKNIIQGFYFDRSEQEEEQ